LCRFVTFAEVEKVEEGKEVEEKEAQTKLLVVRRRMDREERKAFQTG
jgi:hypothetical protein